MDRIDVARNFLAALPSWISTFFGPEALAAWITPAYAVESITYTFLRDDLNRWNGSWESPHDLQVRADLLLLFATNLPIHIENMSLVTATQARNPFERHVKFNTGVFSLGPQSTTTSPGRSQHPQSAAAPLKSQPPNPPALGSDHSTNLPDAVTAAGAPTNASDMHVDDSHGISSPTSAHLHSSSSSSTAMPDLEDPTPQAPAPHCPGPSNLDHPTEDAQPTDVIHDLDPSFPEDQSSLPVSQVSPVTAAGAPSLASP